MAEQSIIASSSEANGCRLLVNAPEQPPAPLMDQWVRLMADTNTKADNFQIGPNNATTFTGKDGSKLTSVDLRTNDGALAAFQITNPATGQTDIYQAGSNHRMSTQWTSSWTGGIANVRAFFGNSGNMMMQSGERFGHRGDYHFGFQYRFRPDGQILSCHRAWTAETTVEKK